MKQQTIFTILGHSIALSIHFLLNFHIISLLTFCTLSLIPPICFAVVCHQYKNKAGIIGQLGWITIAITGIIKNIF